MKGIRRHVIVGMAAAGLLAVMVAAAVEFRASAATAQTAHEQPVHEHPTVAPPRGANVYVRTVTGEEIHGRVVAGNNGQLVIRTSPWRHRSAFMVEIPMLSVTEVTTRAPDLNPFELLAIVGFMALAAGTAADIARSR